MSIEFLDDTTGRNLYSTDWNPGSQIAGFTNCLCRVYGKSEAMVHGGMHGPTLVEPQPFREVVDAVFQQPNVLTFQWAWYAAAMYDRLDGSRGVWEWPVSEIPNDVHLWIQDEYIRLKPVPGFEPYGPPGLLSGVIHSSRLAGSGEQDYRGIAFKATDSDETYGHVTLMTARIFLELTAGLAMLLQEDLMCATLRDEFFIIHKSNFCKLLFAVARAGMDLYFQWFRLAIALFNQMNQPVPRWQWEVSTGLPLMSRVVYDNVIIVEPVWIDGQTSFSEPTSLVLPPDLG